MDYPRISMVTTCYNHAEYVGRTIESVLSQNYPNLQYIVINDGSTDDSEAVIKQYADHLTHWETWEGYRPGPVFALNKAFAMTDGEIMGWLNSDDMLLPNSLFVIASVFRGLPEVDWLTGIASTLNLRDEIVRSHPYYKSVYDYLNRDWKVIQQESTFWRRPLWQRAGGGFPEEFIFGFDMELWSRFFLEAEHYHLNTVVGAFRKGKQSQSTTDLGRFMDFANQALDNLKQRAPGPLRRRARCYRLCKRCLGPLLRLLPVWLLDRLPGLRRFSYKLIEYDFNRDAWKILLINPF